MELYYSGQGWAIFRRPAKWFLPIALRLSPKEDPNGFRLLGGGGWWLGWEFGNSLLPPSLSAIKVLL